MEYITPLQIATESSTVPKSVMKTMVGWLAASAAHIAVQRSDKNNTTKKREGLAVWRLCAGMVGSDDCINSRIVNVDGCNTKPFAASIILAALLGHATVRRK
jgi:hypothetical protein